MNYDFSNLWVEKWRPKTLSDFIISDKNKTIIDSFKDKKEIPNLLFTGTPGLGKTSLAKILVNDILDCQYLYINASDENGIDTIRNKVTGFAQTKSLDGKIKVIILDETDGLSIDAQRALRNTIEEFAKIKLNYEIEFQKHMNKNK
jgi:replication factor C small subunit